MITNLITNKSYVGYKMYDRENPNKVYMGSSKYLNIDIERLGIENFKKIKLEENILFISKEEINTKESYYMHKYDTLNPNGYNRYDPIKGFCPVGNKASEETKLKMRIAQSNRSVETRQKMSIATKYYHSDKVIKFYYPTGDVNTIYIKNK